MTKTSVQRQEVAAKLKSGYQKLRGSEDVDKLLVRCEALEEGRQRLKDLERLIDEINGEQQALANARSNWDKAHREFEEIMPDECPLCNQETKGSAA